MIEKVTVPEGQIGIYKIAKIEIPDNPIERYRYALSGRNYVPGTYTFLHRGNTLVMSDTPDEMSDHYPAVRNAKGHCLVVGLGIGMVLNAVLRKPEVEKVTVVELSSEVLELVAGHYNELYPGKIEFIQADILEWKPPKDVYYNMAWFDIWDDLCIDNLEQMAKLHRRFGKKAEWKGSWGKSYLQAQKRRERQGLW